MKILLLTDIHCWTDTNHAAYKWSEYINSFWAAFEESAKELREVASQVDCIVNLGDFLHQKSREVDIKRYEEWVGFFKSLGKQTLHIAGNHDLSYMDRDTLSWILRREKAYYSTEFWGHLHIVLDGNRKGNINGIRTEYQRYRFDPDQIIWLRDTISQADKPCIVYSHFPMDDQDLSDNYLFSENGAERVFPERYEEVREILENSWKVLAVFSGHTHFSHSSEINGISHHTIWSFSENDGSGSPTKEYAIATIDWGIVTVNFQRI